MLEFVDLQNNYAVTGQKILFLLIVVYFQWQSLVMMNLILRRSQTLKGIHLINCNEFNERAKSVAKSILNNILLNK